MKKLAKLFFKGLMHFVILNCIAFVAYILVMGVDAW